MAKKKICKHDGCFSAPAKGRNECYKCRSRNLLNAKPIEFCYYFLKGNAKRRKKEFTITIQYFKDFVRSNGYMENKGRLSDSLTIDRIENHLGYIPGNLQVISKHDNVVKYHTIDIESELGKQFIGDVPF